MIAPRTSSSIRRSGAALLVGLLLTPGSYAEERVLVLNTDRSVERYQLAHDAFNAAWQASTVEIDLGNPSVDEADIERRITEISPSAVYCIGSKAYLLASQVLKEQTLLLSSAINWQRLPIRKDTLVIANELPAGAELTLFRYFFPQIKRIGVLCSRKYNKEWLKQAQEAGRDADIQIVVRLVKKSSDVPDQLRKLLPKVGAVWLIADPVVLAGTAAIQRIFEQTHEAKKPVFTYSAAFENFGATLMVSPDDPTIGRQAAGLLLAHREHGPLKETVQSPAGSEIALNLGMVQKLDLELNEEALDSVNRIIR